MVVVTIATMAATSTDRPQAFVVLLQPLGGPFSSLGSQVKPSRIVRTGVGFRGFQALE